MIDKKLFMESVRRECLHMLQSEHEEITTFNWQQLFGDPPLEACLLTAGCEDPNGDLWEWRVWPKNVTFPLCLIHTEEKYGDLYFTENYMVSVVKVESLEGKQQFEQLRKSNPV